MAERLTPQDLEGLTEAEKAEILRDITIEQRRREGPKCIGRHDWKVIGSLYDRRTGQTRPVLECSKCPAIKKGRG